VKTLGSVPFGLNGDTLTIFGRVLKRTSAN
jgi:hypothetical protein